MMASTTFRKDTGCTGILHLLLLVMFLPSVLVSGQSASPPDTSMASTDASTSPTAVTDTSSGNTSIQTGNSTNPGGTASTQPSSVSSGSMTAASATTQAGTMATSNAGSASTAQPTTMYTSPASMSTMSPSGSTMASSVSGSNSMNGTPMPYKISCPTFTCNYSDCYNMYTSQNATLCTGGACWCQLIRQTDMCYTVGCSASCDNSCTNITQTNCSVNCCNTTGCLNESFAEMMILGSALPPTTMSTTTTTTPVPTTAGTSPQTANNGNKCHQGTCIGTVCYNDFNALIVCSPSQPHCQLKKETVNSGLQWTAGCTTNCSGQTTCKASAKPPCHLECCNATQTSCLWLNGTLNVPSFATRGPHRNTDLIASLLCLLAIALLL